VKYAMRMSAGGAAGLSAALAMVMSGCKVGPDYVPPMSNAPANFTHADPGEFGGASKVSQQNVPESAWWRTLGDAGLNRVTERAIAGNLDLKLAQSRVLEAMAERGVVAADGLPGVDANTSFTRSRRSERIDNFPGGQMRNNWSVGFDSTWEIDFWGRVARGVEAAEADIDAAIESRRDTMVTLLAEVARNYVELRGFQRRLEIARKNIKLQQQTVELTQARFNAGLTSEVDVAQAKSLLATTQATIPTLDGGMQRSIHRLSVLLGQQPTALKQELSASGPIPAVPTEIMLGLPSELLRRRPDVRRAERELAAATARIGVATADLFPRFSLSGSFGFESIQLSSLAEPGARFWTFGPAMRWPIFQGGRVRSNIAVQNARVDQALTRYEQTVLTCFEDVENSLSAYTREQARMSSLKDAVSANQRAFDLASQLYSNGLSDFLRVLDSQRALFASEDALIDSERAVTSNLVGLYKALGGGWDAVAPAATTVESAGDGESKNTDGPESGHLTY
jgi:outer membrane protein, multidrug efflux system